MSDRRITSTRLEGTLWLIGSALALIAALIRYLGGGEVAWYLIAAGAFTGVMGVSKLRRQGSTG